MIAAVERRSFLQFGAAATVASSAVAATEPMRKQIKIAGLETDVLRMPPGRKYFDAIHEFGCRS
jgi:hypothetical protein